MGEQLVRQVLDFDAEISRREHVSIAEIFGSRGEAHFRKLERALTEELRETGGMVLSPGSGWIANPGCLELLRPPAMHGVSARCGPRSRWPGWGPPQPKGRSCRRPDPAGELRRLLEARESHVCAIRSYG